MNSIAAAGTDPGKKRENNEDAYLMRDEIGLYAVADGVGGSEGGEIASRIAVETISDAIPSMLREAEGILASGCLSDRDPLSEKLGSAVILANRKVRRAQEKSSALSDMATTMTVLLMQDEYAYVAHVGDSRAYLLRSGEFKQLTNDHSFVAEHVRSGLMTAEQARSSPYRHIIMRALGIDEDVRPDVFQHKLQKNDRFLLCTDGLTEMVDDATICAILVSSAPRDAVQQLLAEANNAGGVDNITAVVVWVTEV